MVKLDMGNAVRLVDDDEAVALQAESSTRAGKQ